MTHNWLVIAISAVSIILTAAFVAWRLGSEPRHPPSVAKDKQQDHG